MYTLIKLGDHQIRIAGRILRIARLEAEKYHYLDDPKPVIDQLAKLPTRVDLFTFLQRLPDTTPRFKYPMEMDNLAVLPVSTYDHWWTKQVDNKTRNMCRKGLKAGVEVRETEFNDDLVRGIWEIYNECPVRQGRAFRHYGKDLPSVQREMATFLDTSIFLGAYVRERLIGFIKLTYDGAGKQVGIMSIVSMIRERDRAPTNALLAQAVATCADRGFQWLIYSNFARGNRQRDSIADFKKNNGFQRVDLPRYYVPMNAAGSVAFTLGLHRPLTDFIPTYLLDKYREMRAQWYARFKATPAKAY